MILQQRPFCFVRIYQKTGLVVLRQALLRSGGSSALNFGEFQGAQTEKDKANKLAIALNELKESRINLKILKKVKYGNADEFVILLDEAEQLIKIIASIIRNKK